MEEKVFFKGQLGNICGVLHLTENKDEIVLIIHGFHSTKESGTGIISKHLENKGINVLRIDLDNIGESELDFKSGICISNYVKQVDASISFLKEKGFKKIDLVGTSFGGIVVLNAARRHPEINKILLRAPVFDWQRHMKEKCGEDESKFKFIHTSRQNKTTTYSSNCYYDAKDKSAFDFASEIKQEIMIIQGNADESVNPNIAKEIVDLFPNATLKIIKGGDHTLGVNNDYTQGIQIITDYFIGKK